MGVDDRDYARWTANEKRRFYHGAAAAHSSWIALLAVLAVIAGVVVYSQRHGPPAGSHVRVKTRYCLDPLHKLCGPTLTTSFTR